MQQQNFSKLPKKKEYAQTEIRSKRFIVFSYTKKAAII